VPRLINRMSLARLFSLASAPHALASRCLRLFLRAWPRRRRGSGRRPWFRRSRRRSCRWRSSWWRRFGNGWCPWGRGPRWRRSWSRRGSGWRSVFWFSGGRGSRRWSRCCRRSGLFRLDCYLGVIRPLARQFIRDSKDQGRQQFIFQVLAMFPKNSGKRGQTFQTQPVIHLESETKVVDVPQRLLSIHNSRSPFHLQRTSAESTATGCGGKVR
jgi:hypothetical protein